MANSTQITYKVTGVSQDSMFTGQATPVTGYRVQFTTSTGYDGAVFAPAATFADVAALRALIEGEVQMIAAAQAIAGNIGS
jgi:hypothetical protein